MIINLYFFYSPIKSNVICVYKLNTMLKKKLFSEGLKFLLKKPTLSVKNSISSCVDIYINDILSWYINTNDALLNNFKKPEISLNCNYEEIVQYKIYQLILNQM